MQKIFKYLTIIIMKFAFQIGKLLYKNNKKIFMFGTGFGGFQDNTKYLFLFMINETNNKCYYVIKKKNIYSKLKSDLPVVYYYSLKNLLLSLQASYYIFTHNIHDIYPSVRKNTVKINLWHGSPLKKIGFDSIVENRWIKKRRILKLKLPYQEWDYLVVSHEFFKKFFYTSMKIDERRMLCFGLPRTDYLFRLNYSRTKLVKNKIIGNKKNKKTILYVPTFRDYTDDKTEEILFNLCNYVEKKDYLLILKMHPSETKSLSIKHRENVIVSLDEDIQDLLVISDILISDYSSVFFDYAILQRPIILFQYDYELYKYYRGGLYFDVNSIISNVHVIQTYDDLIETIDNVIYKKNVKMTILDKPNSSKKLVKFMERLYK